MVRRWTRIRRQPAGLMLSPDQRKTITNTANQLRPDLRHSFVLRVERTLAISTSAAFASDALVTRAIDAALREVIG